MKCKEEMRTVNRFKLPKTRLGQSMVPALKGVSSSFVHPGSTKRKMDAMTDEDTSRLTDYYLKPLFEAMVEYDSRRRATCKLTLTDGSWLRRRVQLMARHLDRILDNGDEFYDCYATGYAIRSMDTEPAIYNSCSVTWGDVYDGYINQLNDGHFWISVYGQGQQYRYTIERTSAPTFSELVGSSY